MSLYLVRLRVSMLAFMWTSVWFFFILNLIKVPFAATIGLITADSLRVGLFMSPLMVAGALVGIVIFRRIDQRRFVAAVLILSAIAAVWLLVHG